MNRILHVGGKSCRGTVTDTNQPHTMAVVANMAETLPSFISCAEITALLYLAEHAIADSRFDHHKIIPVRSHWRQKESI